jgi:hypothetical protein
MSIRTNIRKKRFVVDLDANPTIQTFRHDFGEKFMEELKYFAIIHKYDDRKVFKEAWTKWCEQDSIKSQIDQEVERLQSSGYKGDVLDKMFKSARYYFRKRELTVEEKPRKKYVSLSPLFLEQIDKFIMELFTTSDSAKPSSAYEEFCKNKKELISEQVTGLADLESDEICTKLKKTFKNRFHVMKTTFANNK